MDAVPSGGPGESRPGGLLAKAPEAGTVIPGLIQAAVILLPGIPSPVRIILLICITVIALGYGLHLASFLRSQTPLKIVACSTLAAFSFLTIVNVPSKDWAHLITDLQCIFGSCPPPTVREYFVSIHLFRDDDGDNIQGAFDRDLPNTYVNLTYMIGQKPHDVGGYTNERGVFEQALDGEHAITIKVCGIKKDDDGNQPLQLTSDNDSPALTLIVKIGIDGRHYQECFHYSAS